MGLHLKHIWRESFDGYGLLFSEEAEGRGVLLVEVSLEKETGRFVVLPPEPADKATIKERRRDGNAVLRRLRRWLEGARVEAVSAVPAERIVLLDFDARREDGLEEIPRPRLAVELTGRRTNLVLAERGAFDEGVPDRILVVHRHGRGQGGRDLVTGENYELPAQRG